MQDIYSGKREWNQASLEEPLGDDGGLTSYSREERKEVKHGFKKILVKVSGSPEPMSPLRGVFPRNGPS